MARTITLNLDECVEVEVCGVTVYIPDSDYSAMMEHVAGEIFDDLELKHEGKAWDYILHDNNELNDDLAGCIQYHLNEVEEERICSSWYWADVLIEQSKEGSL